MINTAQRCSTTPVSPSVSKRVSTTQCVFPNPVLEQTRGPLLPETNLQKPRTPLYLSLASWRRWELHGKDLMKLGGENGGIRVSCRRVPLKSVQNTIFSAILLPRSNLCGVSRLRMSLRFPQQQQQLQFPPPPPPLYPIPYGSHGGGSVGPVIAVLAVIAVLGAIAGILGWLCSGRTVMGYGHYDPEGWFERKCASCIDGRLEAPSSRPSANGTQAAPPPPPDAP
ncbi:hypothetical protein ZIOFF_071495 [Zingiber officinale]|uniref:Uncharacterized protein n=2 Tax=Zingiber officinale TaxID=94328 RepID=A0A8J5C9R2_ZINOF|nr:hypothetical protein ZIOFF_071495 [Zingiber officinale]